MERTKFVSRGDEDVMKVRTHEAIAEYIHQWGNSASQALLDPACQLFSVPNIVGVIGYRFELKSAIVFGDPVCAPEDRAALAQAFHDYCAKHKKGIVYISATEPFANWAIKTVCKTLISFGDEIILNPMHDAMQRKGKRASLLRNKWNQCLRDGIQVKEYLAYDPVLEQGMEQVAAAWLQGRTGPQMSLLRVDLFGDRTRKRWFYAQYQDAIVGVLMVNSLSEGNGWVINMLMVAPDAPNPTSEFIILSTLQVLRAEQCTYFSVGTTPSADLERLEGINPYIVWVMRKIFTVAKKIFKLSERQRYWKKFYPQTKPLYLLTSNSGLKVHEIIAVIQALRVDSRAL